MSFDDLKIEQQLELSVPRRFVPKRATPMTAGEIALADAEAKERRRRAVEQLLGDLGGGAE